MRQGARQGDNGAVKGEKRKERAAKGYAPGGGSSNYGALRTYSVGSMRLGSWATVPVAKGKEYGFSEEA